MAAKPTRKQLATIMTFVVATAWSADLATAKSGGLVGEQQNGYLGIVRPDVSETVRTLVVDLNNQRRARYQAIADENGIPLEIVEQRAGQRATAKTRFGHYIKDGGQWRLKRDH